MPSTPSTSSTPRDDGWGGKEDMMLRVVHGSGGMQIQLRYGPLAMGVDLKEEEGNV